MMTNSERASKASNDEGRASQPVTQKQEDLLLESFIQLSVQDRKKVIRYIRDLIQQSGPVDVE